MRELAELCALAEREPRAAARRFLAGATEAAAGTLLDVGLWRDADVADFEARDGAVLIAGRWGRYWLASPTCRKALVPAAPRLAPSGMVALARAVADEVRRLHRGGTA